MVYYHEFLFMPRVNAVWAAKGLGNGYSFGNDLYQIWLSTREWFARGSSPYSPQVTEQIQLGLYGRTLDPRRLSDPIDRRTFPYPIFVDLLFWPAASVSFVTLRVVFVCVLAGITLVSILWWARTLGWGLEKKLLATTALLTLSSYAVLEGLYADQLGLIVAFVLAASMHALKQGRFLFAGFLMALTTVKPQVTVLLILYLLFWSFHALHLRKSFVIGFFSTMTLLVGAPLLVQSHWIQEWTRTAIAYHRYTPPPLLALVLSSQVPPSISPYVNTALTLLIVAGALMFCWKTRTTGTEDDQFWIAISILLALTTIVMLPGQAVYDHVILLPGILLLFKYRHALYRAGRATVILQSVGIVVLFWPWALATVFLLLHPILPQGLLDSSAFLSLPIRTAASLPFAVLALLVWTWRIRPRDQKAVS